jgi:hypothetical protein
LPQRFPNFPEPGIAGAERSGLHIVAFKEKDSIWRTHAPPLFFPRSLIVENYGTMVSVSNLAAAEGPAGLSLHDACSSAAGLVLRRGQMLQGGIHGRSGRFFSGLSDVQEAVRQCPECTYVIVMPFAAAHRGALLLGFPSAPQLSTQ